MPCKFRDLDADEQSVFIDAIGLYLRQCHYAPAKRVVAHAWTVVAHFRRRRGDFAATADARAPLPSLLTLQH